MRVVQAIASACARTADALRTTRVEKVQSTNEFGDDVLTADIVADQLICEELAACDVVASFSSEEHPALTKTENKAGAYCVTFDPLDGSSIIDTNFTVGSIFAIWRGSDVIGQRVNDICASVVCVYGPRTTLFVAHRVGGVFEYILVGRLWCLARSSPYVIKPTTKFFSPGNLRAANSLPQYRGFLKQAVRDKLTLRYTGGMVPDVTQILVKGSGLFVTPVGDGHKVKLRVCFECGPLAHMVVSAGGAARDHNGKPYLETTVSAMDQRSGVALGSSSAVSSFVDMMSGQDPSPRL